MTPLRIVLYGGEDYRIYDGTRLVATVYAERDLWRFNVQAITNRQGQQETTVRPEPLSRADAASYDAG